MAVIGYARVSSIGQSLEIQIDNLSKYGCEKIYKEKRSGTTAQRPEMKACLDYVRSGDVLVITKLDRLARSIFHLHKIVNDLNIKDVGFKVLDQSFDTTTKDGRLMFSILASIAEFETELRSERQLEGIAKAKQNGVAFGRKSKLTEKEVNSMIIERATGSKIKVLMQKYNLSKASVYRIMSQQIKSLRNLVTFEYIIDDTKGNWDIDLTVETEVSKLTVVELSTEKAISELAQKFNVSNDSIEISIFDIDPLSN